MKVSEERGQKQFGTNRHRPLTEIIGTLRLQFEMAQRSAEVPAAFRESIRPKWMSDAGQLKRTLFLDDRDELRTQRLKAMQAVEN